MTIPRRALLVGLGLALASISSDARADAKSDALADVTKARAGVKTLVAPFTQERTIGLLATAVKSRGEMTLVRPDRLRWELFAPDAITYWMGPEGFSYATPGGGGSVGKAAAGKFAPVLGDLMILLGGDLQKLRARYDITVASRAPLALDLKPRDAEVKRSVSSIHLEFGSDLWAVRRVVIEEPGGDRSVIVFTKVDRDVAVDAKKMKPPK